MGEFDFEISFSKGPVWDFGKTLINRLLINGIVDHSFWGFGSTNRLLIADAENGFEIPTSFVEASPDGYSLSGFSDVGEFILSAPIGTIADGETFDSIFVGWDVFSASTRLHDFFSDANVRVQLATAFPEMGTAPNETELIKFDQFGSSRVVGMLLVNSIPEPSSFVLCSLCVVTIAAIRRRREQHSR